MRVYFKCNPRAHTSFEKYWFCAERADRQKSALRKLDLPWVLKLVTHLPSLSTKPIHNPMVKSFSIIISPISDRRLTSDNNCHTFLHGNCSPIRTQEVHLNIDMSVNLLQNWVLSALCSLWVLCAGHVNSSEALANSTLPSSSVTSILDINKFSLWGRALEENCMRSVVLGK